MQMKHWPVLSSLEEMLHVLLKPEHAFSRRSHAWFFCSFNGTLKKEGRLVSWPSRGLAFLQPGHPMFEFTALCSVRDQKKEDYAYGSISTLFKEHFVVLTHMLEKVLLVTRISYCWMLILRSAFSGTEKCLHGLHVFSDIGHYFTVSTRLSFNHPATASTFTIYRC